MFDDEPGFPAVSDEALSAIHHALRSTRRRYVVLLLTKRAFQPDPKDAHEEPVKGMASVSVSVRELSRAIVAFEENVSPEHASGPAYHNVYSSLIQSHLPRLEEMAAIEYDDQRKLVKPGENLAALATVAAVSSPLTQMLFHSAVANLFAGGSVSPEDSITD